MVTSALIDDGQGGFQMQIQVIQEQP